jgi:carbamoyltransferase
MWVLGINHSLHESSVCLLRDDEVVFATAEERLSRIKYDSSFPRTAIVAALHAACITPDEIAAIGLSWPRATVGLLHDLRQVLRGAMPVNRWYVAGPIVNRLRTPLEGTERALVRHALGPRAASRLHFFSHHRSHALSAAVVAARTPAAILVADGRGARNATSIWARDDTRLRLVAAKFFPDSLGLFYARFTQYLGFTPLADEWKVMGLAPYGDPGLSVSDFIRVGHEDYTVDGKRLLAGGFPDLAPLERVFGPARRPDEPLTDRHKAVARAAQDAVERAMLAMARRALRLTGAHSLALAGGVAMNVKANGMIRDAGIAEEITVQPAASDEGSALGAAIAAQLAVGGKPFLGPLIRVDYGEEPSDEEIARHLTVYRLTYSKVAHPAQEAARRLAHGQIIGWFQGRTEFGPRALGHRSILADPRDVTVRDRVNQAVKFREEWRPFAPSVIEERAHEFFDDCTTSPFMIMSFQVRPEMSTKIPAVVHIDGTARVHTVRRDVNPLYWSLIATFARITGIPVVLNTSFNLKGDPIVNSVKDAVATFFTSGLDALVIGPYVVEKGPLTRGSTTFDP